MSDKTDPIGVDVLEAVTKAVKEHARINATSQPKADGEHLMQWTEEMYTEALAESKAITKARDDAIVEELREIVSDGYDMEDKMRDLIERIEGEG